MDAENGSATTTLLSQDDIIRAFSNDEDREQLKQAILECTREEVAKTLNALIFRGGNSTSAASKIRASADDDAKDCSLDLKTNSGSWSHPSGRERTNSHKCQTKVRQDGQRSLSSPHLQRTVPSKKIDIYSQRRKSSHATKFCNKPSSPRTVPLESIEIPPISYRINRSSLNLIEKSVSIVSKATGRSPKRYEEAFQNNLIIDRATNQNVPSVKECNERNKHNNCSFHQIDGLQRVESRPEQGYFPSSLPRRDASYRPMTTTRLIHSSHSVLNPKPLRRTITTTALERRKPPPSTAASERTKAERISKRLLGPITIESKRENYNFVVPHSLNDDEWENELARNIINVFSNKVRSEKKGEGSNKLLDFPTTIADEPLFPASILSSEIDFKNNHGDDTQLPSISREIENKAIRWSISEDVPRRESQSKLKSALGRKGSKQNGTFGLKMIWFTGTGMVRANWDALNDVVGENAIDREELSELEEHLKYVRYIETVENSIAQWHCKTLGMEKHSNLKQMLWQQLVITCNSFATILIEKRKYARSMELLEKTTSLISSELGLLPQHICEELSGMAKDTYAYYYMRRSKPSASLQYLISAINIYKRRNDALNLAKCRLHESFIHCAQNKCTKSMECLRKILTMVEDGALDIESDNNQVLLLVSVTYHNIAVQQLMLGHVSDACVSSQNSRRLARLCLSVSSHYLPMLESTHKKSLHELSLVLKNSQCEQQATLFQNLISELFD